MKKISLFLSAALCMVTVGCSSSTKEAKEEKSEEALQITEPAIVDQNNWRLIDYVGADGSVNEVGDGAISLLRFNDEEHTFGLSTDCNSLGGEYKIMGDSISFENIACTEMACPSMKIEEAMKELLPRVDTYAINSDSILRLRSDMRIIATFVKSSKNP